MGVFPALPKPRVDFPREFDVSVNGVVVGKIISTDMKGNLTGQIENETLLAAYQGRREQTLEWDFVDGKDYNVTPDSAPTMEEACGTTKTDERYGVRVCALLPGHIKHERNFHVANVGPGWLDKDSDEG